MKLTNNEKMIQKQLQADIEIPSIVTDKAHEAYRTIEARKIKQAAPRKNPYTWMQTTAKVVGGAAAVLAVGFVVCVTNPVMAKELPLVGGLFEQLQDKVSFFGNFADNATPLEEPVQTEAADSVYTKTCDGLTLTFSEVYANEQAIYLTMLAKSEEPFPDTMIYDTEEGTKRPDITMNVDSKFSFLDEIPDGVNVQPQIHPEGIFLDENTYSCIIRIDLESVSKDYSEYNEKYSEAEEQVLNEMGITSDDISDGTEEGYALLSEYIDKLSARTGSLSSCIKDIPVPDEFTLQLNIQQFIGLKAEPKYWDSGYSYEELAAMSDEEWREVMSQEPAEYRESPNKYQNYWYDGPWTFDIPIQIDNSQTEVLELNDTNEEGIGLESVIKTPYEITVNELYQEGAYSDTFMVALDANGNKLPYNDSNSNCSNFAIQDRDISTVDIYILDYVQYMDELKGEDRYNNNENKPEEEKWSTLLDANALYHTTIHF